MSTASLVLAIRAIAIEFARRIYVPVLIVFIVVALLLLVALWWLISISAWWWLLAVPLLFIASVGTVLITVVGVLLRILRRTSSAAQRRVVSDFVDSLQEVSEVVQTPKVYILYRLVKDIVRPTDESYIKTITGNTKTLRLRFKSVIASF